MPNQVEHNGKIHEFPDDATPEMMEEVLGLSSSSSSSSSSKSKVPKSFENIVDTNWTPWQTLMNVGSGLGQGGQNITSTLTGGKSPRVDMDKILGVKSRMPLVQGLAKNAPAIAAGGTSLLKQMLTNSAYSSLQHQPGEENLFGLLPSNRTGAAIEGAAIPAALKGLGLGYKAISSPFKIAKNAFKNLSPHEKIAQKYASESSNAEQALQESKDKSMFPSISKSENELGKRQNELSSMKKPELDNHPIKSSKESQSNLDKAENLHNKSKENFNNAEKRVKTFLNEGSQHDIRSAEGIHKNQEKIRKSISNKYKEIENNLKEKNVTIDNTSEIKDKNKEFLNLVKSGNLHSKESDNLLKTIEKLQNENGAIPANKYLRMIRSAKKYANEARQNAYKPGMDAELRAEWESKYNGLDNKIEEMEQTFRNHVDPEHIAALESANELWKTKVVPLQRNSTYQNIKFKGRMPKDIMYTLRGTDPGDVLMKDIIKNDQNILRNVVGQKYSKKPHLLHEAGELDNEYINNSPQLKRLMDQHKFHSERSKSAQDYLSQSKKSHENIVKNEPTLFKKSEGQQKKLSEYENSKSRIENEIKTIENDIKRLTEDSKKRDISLDKKMRIEKKLDSLRRQKKKSQKYLYYGAGLALGSPTLKWMLKGNSIKNEEGNK